ncbi:MAG: winged helix-turn-helix domain-containing protein [Myxococcota bacterium]
MRWRFGAFRLDDEGFRLTRAGEPVALRRKVFDLLVLLVRERARVVPREELVERLWATTAVGSGSLSGLVNELRSALGEDGAGGSSIRTVHARGYQFVAPVEAEPAFGSIGALSAFGRGADAGPSPGAARVRLERARLEVGRSGARALAATVPEPAQRARWLAAMLAEAREAGFTPRFEVVAGECVDRPIGGALAPLAFEAAGPPGPGSPGPRPAVDGARGPIALGLEIREPGTWARAGGLVRLLDLLGRAPVLVIAGLAAPLDEARARGLLLRDARIEWAGEGELERALLGGRSEGEGEGRAGAGGAGHDRLAAILHALADADEASLLAALRRLGFEVIRPEPSRILRRVAPPASPALERRHADRS